MSPSSWETSLAAPSGASAGSSIDIRTADNPGEVTVATGDITGANTDVEGEVIGVMLELVVVDALVWLFVEMLVVPGNTLLVVITTESVVNIVAISSSVKVTELKIKIYFVHVAN